jgi:KUP system potassium uptake protein
MPISPPDPAHVKERVSRALIATLAVAALGVVFGDIGTSPLYTLKACFEMSGAQASRPGDVLGIASLLVWTLVVVVCLKYVTFIMQIDHDGEGGILALLARARPASSDGTPVRYGIVTVVVIIGAAMLLGDGAITPAISVISAIEGLDVASPIAHPYLVPIAIVILAALFALQSRGTGKVGKIFGPAMIAWFLAIGIAGAIGIASHPAILAALDPLLAARFMLAHGPGGFFVLGGIVLAVTGVEALYADMSHFGRRPIVIAWYGLVFPSLVLCYVGESARILEDPTLLANPFYALTPGWTLYPAIAIATMATVIASQALISGAFTLAEQAIALGLWPRMRVNHTSADVRGQVFVPAVNGALAIGCILLVIAFKSSDRLAAAFGLAVSGTMLATSIAYYVVVSRVLRWPAVRAVPLLAAFVVVDGSFVLAGLPKFVDGGWVPFAVATTLSFASIVWLRGRRRVVAAIKAQSTPLEEVVAKFGTPLPPGAPAMVFLTPDENRIPFIAKQGWVRDRAHEEHVVLLRLRSGANPTVPEPERVRVDRLAPSLTRIVATFGYMEAPRIAPIVEAARAQGLDLERGDTSFFYAEPKIEDPRGGDGSFAQQVFVMMQRIARPLPDDLGIPAERRIELSVSVDYNAQLIRNDATAATKDAR